MEFNSLENLVQQYLEQVPATRSDDFKLYFLVAADIYGDNGFNPTPGETDFMNLPIYDFVMNHNQYGLPAFESVSRARRKIQSEHRELCDEKTKEYRAKREEEFRERYGSKNSFNNCSSDFDADWNDLFNG